MRQLKTHHVQSTSAWTWARCLSEFMKTPYYEENTKEKKTLVLVV